MNRILPLLLLIVFTSCDSEEPLTREEVNTIRYGTSFGMCVDYCLTDMEVSAEWIYYTRYGWKNSVTPKSRTVDFDVQSYDDLLAMVDKDKFLALEAVIGCPDCADGGAEWIEMQIDGRTKKVTFEYMEDIDGISEVVEELRKLVSQLSS